MPRPIRLLLSFVMIIMAAVSAQQAQAKDMIGPSIESFTSIAAGKVTSSSFAENPSTMTYAEDLAGVYNFGLFLAGVGGSFRHVAHMSDVNPAVGNFKGNRWDLSPVVGAGFGSWLIMAEPIFFGRYSLSKQTVAGQDVSYKNPLGARLFVDYDFFGFGPIPRAGVALMFDMMSYGKVSAGGVDTDLTNKLGVWSLGAAFHIGLF